MSRAFLQAARPSKKNEARFVFACCFVFGFGVGL